jgi:hypothetical protein
MHNDQLPKQAQELIIQGIIKNKWNIWTWASFSTLKRYFLCCVCSRRLVAHAYSRSVLCLSLFPSICAWSPFIRIPSLLAVALISCISSHSRPKSCAVRSHDVRHCQSHGTFEALGFQANLRNFLGDSIILHAIVCIPWVATAWPGSFTFGLICFCIYFCDVARCFLSFKSLFEVRQPVLAHSFEHFASKLTESLCLLAYDARQCFWQKWSRRLSTWVSF